MIEKHLNFLNRSDNSDPSKIHAEHAALTLQFMLVVADPVNEVIAVKNSEMESLPQFRIAHIPEIHDFFIREIFK